MFHRFIDTVRMAVFGLLAVSLWQPAAAEQHNYDGTFTLCISTCDSFAALGGPGGAANPQPSVVSGNIQIPNSGPNQSFAYAVSDNIQFAFEIFNSNAPMETAMFDGMGNFLNPTTANPLPLNPSVAEVEITNGSTDASGVLNGGEIAVTFTQPPFSSNGGQVFFDLTNGSAQGFLFGGVILFTEIDGAFSVPAGEAQLTGAPVVFPDTATGETSSSTVTVTNIGEGNLAVSSVASINPLGAPFSIGMDGCTAQVLAPMGTCDLQVDFAPTLMGGAFADSFDIVSNDPLNPSLTVDVSGLGLEPNLQATPFPLSFVATSIGETSQAVSTVTNTGTADLVIGQIDFTGLDPQFSPALDNCSLTTLPPAGTCTLTMEFAPQGEGIFTTEFIFVSNDANLPFFNYELEGEGIVGTIATITVAPGSLTFDELLVGETAELAIQLNSTGNDPLLLNAFTLSGPDAAEFSQTNTCPMSLPSGQACTINVVFTPVTGGDKDATLTVDSNGSLRPMLDIPLAGSAFAGPRIVVSSTTLELGSPSAPVDVGDSTTADVTVSNTGTDDLAISMVSIVDAIRGGVLSTEFTVDNNGCATPVAPLGSCTITVGFAPLTDADKMAQMIIVSDDVANPNTIIDLTGFVFRGARVDVPETVVDIDGGTEIEIGQSADFDLNIGNSGTENLDITGFMLGGADANAFSFTETCVGAPIMPGGSCVVTITFAPASSGEKTAELSIFSNDVTLVRAATIVVPLTATAVAPVVIPPAAPGSQTVQPPAFARADPGGGSLGVGLLGLGLILLLVRRRAVTDRR